MLGVIAAVGLGLVSGLVSGLDSALVEDDSAAVEVFDFLLEADFDLAFDERRLVADLGLLGLPLPPRLKPAALLSLLLLFFLLSAFGGDSARC